MLCITWFFLYFLTSCRWVSESSCSKKAVDDTKAAFWHLPFCLFCQQCLHKAHPVYWKEDQFHHDKILIKTFCARFCRILNKYGKTISEDLGFRRPNKILKIHYHNEEFFTPNAFEKCQGKLIIDMLIQQIVLKEPISFSFRENRSKTDRGWRFRCLSWTGRLNCW